MAHRGTVFLDEIGEMDLNVQAKLLRVLQEREVCRLGDDKIIPVDIRIISATNKDLEELVRQKLFREDLLYRLNVLELRLPPLRERTGDIPLLIKAYNGKQNHPVTFLPEAVRLLEAQPYPGNIRQLFNLLERTITLSDGDMIEASQLANILHLPSPALCRTAVQKNRPSRIPLQRPPLPAAAFPPSIRPWFSAKKNAFWKRFAKTEDAERRRQSSLTSARLLSGEK